MGEQNNILPNYFDLENQRSKLIENTLNTSSGILRVFHFYKYFSMILDYRDSNIEEAFLKEFIDDYLSAISKFEIWGIDPQFTRQLIVHLEEFKNRSDISNNAEALSTNITRLTDQFNNLLLILDGKEIKENYEPKACFPLIDYGNSDGFYGIIDSVTVRINKTTTENKFIIVPSEKNSDQRIIEQCSTSWQLALKKLIHYVRKPYKYHEIIINFEKKEGYYEGNSLGIALTISFLDQLLKFYNPVYSINIAQKTAFTGAVTNMGETIGTGEQIIRQKLAAVFFSDIKTFVFPNSEEVSARKELNELKNIHPNRVLKLIPAEDISDILNRRDIVEIKKRNIIVRTGKFAKQNWISAGIVIILTILLTYLFAFDFDDNPANLSTDGNVLYVKNKNSKILFTKIVPISNNAQISRNVLIVDINSDGKNEIVICNEHDNKMHLLGDNSLLKCYNRYGQVVWQSLFSDEVYSEKNELLKNYDISMLDTISVYGTKNLFIISRNTHSFSSAIYRINLLNGEREPGTFWASGHIMDGILKDINGDGKIEMLGVGADNGYEDLVFFAYNIDTLTKARPTTENYKLKNIPLSEMIANIRFPKTDFDIYNKSRIPGYLSFVGFNDDKMRKKYMFSSVIPPVRFEPEIGYEISYNMKDIDITVSNDFRVQRDTLVAHGILKPPYTDTEEYKNIIKSHILYWEKGKWVKRNELN